jgi:hypothetical protein
MFLFAASFSRVERAVVRVEVEKDPCRRVGIATPFIVFKVVVYSIMTTGSRGLCSK